MIYFDSSALVRLVRVEAETGALRTWLDTRTSVRWVTSSLSRVEVVRAVRSSGDDAIQRAVTILVELDQLPMTHDLLDTAGLLPQALRSSDAIHLASAMRLLPDLQAFVAYDKRLLSAADEVGLPTASPGTS